MPFSTTVTINWAKSATTPRLNKPKAHLLSSHQGDTLVIQIERKRLGQLQLLLLWPGLSHFVHRERAEERLKHAEAQMKLLGRDTEQNASK